MWKNPTQGVTFSKAAYAEEFVTTLLTEVGRSLLSQT